MKVLVTGGAGFIGSHFVKFCLQAKEEPEVLVLDALTYAADTERLEEFEGNDRFFFVEGDVRDKKTVSQLVPSCDVIVHFAAETHVDRSLLFADDFLSTDVFGTFVLLEAARAFGVKRFVHISTDEVYGECPQQEGCDESFRFGPKSPYASSKAGADLLVSSYVHSYEIPAVIVRGVNNYGPWQHPEKMIPLFITQALQNRAVPLYGDGENVREWIYVEDFVEAIWQLVAAEEVEGEVFNIGSGERLTNMEVARKILDLVNSPDSLVSLVKDRPGHVRRHAVDASKFRERFSWAPRVGFAEGLKRTVAWYRENERWWRKVRRQEAFQAFAASWYRERGGEV